jgi:hypothetical protein
MFDDSQYTLYTMQNKTEYKDSKENFQSIKIQKRSMIKSVHPNTG